MNPKKMSASFMRAVPMIVVFAIGFVGLNFIGCGGDDTETGEGITDLTGEEQRDLARFVEYLFFPTSPYIDKSWIEEVPEDELATSEIDFPTETAAIQKVYTEVYNAWNAEDFEAVAAQFYPSTIRFVFLCSGELGIKVNRLLSKYALRKPWNVCNGGWLPLSSGSLLTEFYIRRQNVQAPWPEASAKTADDTYVYLTKRGDKWYMNELVVTRYGGNSYTGKSDTRKYFDTPKYKVP